MIYDESPYMERWLDVPGRTGRRRELPRILEAPFDHWGLSRVISEPTDPALYPKVYHKLRPYIKSACEDMDRYETISERMIDEKCGHIHDSVIKLHPDLFEHECDQDYRHREDEELVIPAHITMHDELDRWDGKMYGHPMDGWKKKPKCLLRDLIKILFIKELYKRRSRRWW